MRIVLHHKAVIDMPTPWIASYWWTPILLLGFAARVGATDLSPLEELGKQIFFDRNLSTPAGQSCADCHSPEAGFTGPDSEINATTAIYPGAAPGKAGNRKPPSVAYASFSPKPTYNEDDETYVGGQFWDGRAATLMEQAQGPFLNPLEMNNKDAWEVVQKIQKADYRDLFEEVYGENALDVGPRTAEIAFHRVARAIAAYETSSEVNAFSSKYDAYLAGRARLTPAERRGLRLFEGKANCSACHPSRPGDDGTPPLFTDFTYDNVGAPRNPRNPFYKMASSVNPEGRHYRDLGIGGVRQEPEHEGKVKVPTLRNVARKPYAGFVKAYLHNGVFKSLEDVVHFYNVRDRQPDAFDPPDVPQNVNRDELGDLGLTEDEEADLVAFLKTLSDGYRDDQDDE
jgi:cytochrome c peroxidase